MLLPCPEGLVESDALIAVEGSKIVGVGESAREFRAREQFCAKGLMVLPGLLDTQVHFREPGLTHKEDIEHGSLGAVLGGVTGFFEMPNTQPPTTTARSLEHKLQVAKARSYCNYAFFVGAAPNNLEHLKHLEQLEGVCGVKIFMGSSTGSLLLDRTQLIKRAFELGQKRVAVHAENEARLKERLAVFGKKGGVGLHPLWRDEECALLATKEACALARAAGRALHVLHVSTAKEMEFLKKQKQQDPLLSVEVTPQHLTLAAPECYERVQALAQCNPPIRDKRHQEALWQAVQEGVVDVLGSDHAPHTLEEKSLPWPKSPSGLTGVQTMVPIMLTHVHNKKLSLKRLVELMCVRPCALFGVKHKGRIEVGYDADFSIVDLGARHRLSNKHIVSKSGWTAFDGFDCVGAVHSCIVGGRVVVREGACVLPSPPWPAPHTAPVAFS